MHVLTADRSDMQSQPFAGMVNAGSSLQGCSGCVGRPYSSYAPETGRVVEVRVVGFHRSQVVPIGKWVCLALVSSYVIDFVGAGLQCALQLSAHLRTSHLFRLLRKYALVETHDSI
jgi:hypothetical protein